MSNGNIPSLAEYSALGLLSDGSSIQIRAIRPDDRARLVDHFKHLSPESVYFRFLGVKRTLTEADLDRFTRLDYATSFALVAVRYSQAQERILGVGRYVAAAQAGGGAAKSAEVAFAVADEYQGRGIGTLLLEHLGRIAFANGIERLNAMVLGSNTRMLEVFARSGYTVRQTIENGLVHVSFRCAESEAFLSQSLMRESLAAVQSVGRLLRPRSVAIIGASHDPHKVGGAVVANLKQASFTGAIYPINASRREIQGLQAFATVSAVGKPVDVAVVCIPARAVEAAVRDCAAAGVRGLVVISSGFAEVQGAGSGAQARLVELVRSSGMRMVGPNCMGIINTDPEVAMNATFAPVAPATGNIGMLSQSGALGMAILDQARLRDIGISSFVSVGNKADVSSNDMLAYWGSDPRTAVIALYLESFGNPGKFARLARSVARHKPIVALKSGRSTAGKRAALSHSASLASLDVAVDALFEQCGVIRTETLEQFFDVATLLSSQPLPDGPRVGVVTNAGGPAILIADACEANGLILPELGAATQEALKASLTAHAGVSNPVDMTATATADDFQRAMALVGADPAIDSVIAIYIPPLVSDPVSIAAGIARGAALVSAHKPVLHVLLSSAPAPAELHQGQRGRIPRYGFPENAATALAAANRYALWRKRPAEPPLVFDDAAYGTIRAIVSDVLQGTQGPQWVAPRELDRLLRAAGIDTVFAEQTTPEEAATVASRMGFPLVAKIVSAEVVHKTDVGGVVMGLRSLEEVNAAVAGLVETMRKLGKRLDGILLQREISGGIEALAGLVDDPTFGKTEVCALGGVAVEIIKDVVFRVPPVTSADAADMVASLRSSRLLDGFRGAPAGDRAALEHLLVRLSALAEAVPEIVEMDLNPVKVLPPGQGALVLDARMRLDSSARVTHLIVRG